MEKILSPFQVWDVKKRVYQDTAASDLRLRLHHWFIWETTCQGLQKESPSGLFRQEVISHKSTERYCPKSNGLAKRLHLTIMDKVLCMPIDATCLPISGLILHFLQIPSSTSSRILHSITTRVQMTLMDDRLNTRSSTSSVAFVMFFNHQDFCISWVHDL